MTLGQCLVPSPPYDTCFDRHKFISTFFSITNEIFLLHVFWRFNKKFHQCFWSNPTNFSNFGEKEMNRYLFNTRGGKKSLLLIDFNSLHTVAFLLYHFQVLCQTNISAWNLKMLRIFF